MALSHIRDRGPHPESVTKLTLAQVTLEALLTPNCKAEDALRVARNERKEELDHDPLGSARGIVNGLRLSVTLWSFVTLVVLLTQ
jgi:D-alanyl-D-alanine carboxypeptidase